MCQNCDCDNARAAPGWSRLGQVGVKGDGRSGKQRIRRTGGGPGGFCSRWTSFTVAFSLLVQLLFIPYHQALAAPAFAAPDDPARIEARLRAIFGDAAALCVGADDRGAPTGPARHAHEDCPFCRFAAEAAALVIPPDPGCVPAPPDPAIATPRPGAGDPLAPLCRGRPGQARAPPPV